MIRSPTQGSFQLVHLHLAPPQPAFLPHIRESSYVALIYVEQPPLRTSSGRRHINLCAT